MPGKLLKSLPFTYSELGYKKLELLNKTDCKWLVEAWGEAQIHSTLNQLHKNVWDEYENKLIEKWQRDSDKLWSEPGLPHGNKTFKNSKGEAKKRNGTAGFLIIIIVAIILIYVFYG